MRCVKVQKLISAQSDGELDQARKQLLERHLSGCEPCRAFAEDLVLVAARLDYVEAPEPRWGFADRVLTRVSSERPAASVAAGFLDLLRPAPLGLGAAAFALGVAVTILANGVNGEVSAGGERDAVIEAVAGDYESVHAEASVHEQLWDLLPDSED